MFPVIWNAKDAYNAFLGYGKNQMKKMVENKDARWEKYAKQHILVLFWFEELMRVGTFPIHIPDGEVKDTLVDIRAGRLTMGECLDIINRKKAVIQKNWNGGYYSTFKDKRTDLEKANAFLHMIRRKYFWRV